MMKRICVVIFSFISVYAFAETLTLNVMDRDLECPLEGVMIQVVGSDGTFYTDANGVAFIELPEEQQRMVILAQLPGYESLRYSLSAGESELVLEMVIAGVIEGNELVVEGFAPGGSDEVSGVSIVMDAERMDTTANVGIVEDVMSTIKTLPGVTYSGGFNAQPSIRGGDPQSMAAMLDGIYVTYPYHWGGTFSIFNPNMTESAKLSHGVFSARYGRALSGILEVNTKEPEDDLRADLAFSTISTELFLQLPLIENMGLFIGGKVTYLDTVVWMNQKQDEIPTPPYIRDFYGKWNYQPVNNMRIYINGFLGSDGVGADVVSEEDSITSDVHFALDNICALTSFGMEWSPHEDDLLSFGGGYNYNKAVTEAVLGYGGTRPYSDGFIDTYGFMLGGATEYTLDGMGLQYEDTIHLYQGQARFQWEHLINDSNLLCFGVDEVFLYTEKSRIFEGYLDINGKYAYNSYNSSEDGNKTIHSSVYSVWEFGSEKSPLQGELGLRGEHFYLWNEDLSLQTLPLLNPRLQIRWSPFDDPGILDSLTFSLGSGLFSWFPLETTSIMKEWDLNSIEVKPARAFYQTIGGEISFLDDWKFKLEGYYKYFFSRLYVTKDTEVQPVVYDIHNDGIGHAAGFDFMLEKEISKTLDGYLSYTFVYMRLLNPYSASDSETTVEPSGAPLNCWYYPDYHRFQTVNLVLNWRFHQGWTFTATATYASGAPKENAGDIYVHPTVYNEQIVEGYSRESEYSDTLRNDFSIPLNLRLSYKFYGKNSKWQHEFYLGIEDILSGIYSPQGVTKFSTYTGEEEPGGVGFNMGIPVPSIGYKASY